MIGRRGELIGRVMNILLDAGFMVSEKCTIIPRCFDIVAKKDTISLILKILLNIDSVKEDSILELKKLASKISAHPLLIGEKAGNQDMEHNVVYFRWGVPAVNIDTFYDCIINSILPLVYAERGGYYIQIDEKKLGLARKEKNLSIGNLASMLGVSRRTVSKYEEGMRTTVDIAIKLEEVLKMELIKEINIFSDDIIEYNHDENKDHIHEEKISLLEQKMIKYLINMGLDISLINYSPFNVLSKIKDEVILTGVTHLDNMALKKAKLTSSISSVIDRPAMFILDKEPPTKALDKIDNILVLNKKDIKYIKDIEGLIELISSKEAS